jgi:hypothetical protein
MIVEACRLFGDRPVTVFKTSALHFTACFFTAVTTLGSSFQTAAKAQAPFGTVARVYTHIDDVRANKGGLCRKISRSGDREDPVLIQRCSAGPGGWPVTMVSGDARVYVSFGREARAGATVMDALNGEFADPNSVVEWRLRDGRPYAAIQRYFLDRKQVLTVHRLNDDGSSCVAAVVAVERGHDANAEAARIADDMVPVFRCGVDKLITTGRGTSSSN